MSQPTDTHDRIDEVDDAMFEPFGHSVTTNEIHALLLGTVGLVAGYSTPILGPLLPCTRSSADPGSTPSITMTRTTDR